MSLMPAWEIAELPVLTAAILSALIYWARQQSAENRERDKAMAKQSQALAVLVESIRPLRSWADQAEVRLTRVTERTNTLSETTAVLAASLEDHQRWHERHDRETRR